MPRIRPFRPGDEAALSDICVKTGDAGGDATGLLADDDIWGAIWALPYAKRHPEFAFVVESDDDRVVGYVLGAPDTAAFEEWFHDEWWPVHGAERWPLAAEPATRQERIVAMGYAVGARGGSLPFGPDYPAHLHIDLLPETQGQGLGRRLIETLTGALREAGVPGVHLVAAAENAGASAFYPRVGFTPLPADDSVRAFGMRL